MKFVDVKNDIAFRKIFGNENRKISLISFLNAVLELPGKNKIADVTIMNPYQLPKLNSGKATIVDVKAKDLNGRTFIIEMQVAEKEYFSKRVLYYTSQSYTDQIERGDLYHKLNSTFFIGILDFPITKNPNYLNRHRVLDVETGENVVSDMEFNFIELPKFTLKLNQLKTIVEQWVYFIKNAENLDVIPESIKDKGLKGAFEEADRHNWTKRELEEYNKVFIREQDDRGRLNFAINKAKNEGKLEGKIEGKIEVAKQLKENGADIKLIIKSTGLTEEVIRKL